VLVWRQGDGLFMALMFGSLAYSSYATLKAYDRSVGFGGEYDQERDW
jgi:hypothetical protein